MRRLPLAALLTLAFALALALPANADEAARKRNLWIVRGVTLAAIAWDAGQTHRNAMTPRFEEHDGLSRPFIHRGASSLQSGLVFVGFAVAQAQVARALHIPNAEVWSDLVRVEMHVTAASYSAAHTNSRY